MKTMICFILDRSGSMQGKESDVIGGVNSFIDEQKKLPDPATLAMVRFDSEGVERFREMKPLADVTHISAGDYQPRGGTPLLDAVGRTIVALDDDWKREQPDRCIVVIVTDGQENESREYTKQKIKALVQSRQDSGKWAFVYLGANVDSFAEAGAMGIAGANTANYVPTSRGIASAFTASSNTVAAMRTTGATVATNLGGDIAEDGGVLIAPNPTATQAATPASKTAWTPPTTGGSATTTPLVWTPPQ